MLAPSPVQREALSPAEVATSIGISKTALYALWRRGAGPPRVRIGDRVLVTVSALRAWLDANVEGSSSKGST